MSEDDRRRWNERYRQGAGAGPPRPMLVEVADLLGPPAAALDLACGTGAEACWLAGRGWRVTALDVSDEALTRAAEAVSVAGVADRVVLARADLDAGLPAAADGTYQLVWAGHFRSAVVEAAAARLAPGGLLVTTRLSRVGRDGDGAVSPAFCADPGELLALADRVGLVVLVHREGAGEAALVARRPSPGAHRPRA